MALVTYHSILVAIFYCLVGRTSGFLLPDISLPRSQEGLFSHSRRAWILEIGGAALPLLSFVEISGAKETEISPQVEMKLFEDPLFKLSVPSNFFTLRRTQKGDLPDSKTGKGRRGSSIFTAGNMGKAEIISVEVSKKLGPMMCAVRVLGTKIG